MTIFATDKGGLVYDLKLIANMFSIFNSEWYFSHGDGWGETQYSILRFYESGDKVYFEAGEIENSYHWLTDKHEYEYTVHLAENAPDNQRPGVITFHRSRDYPSLSDASYFFYATILGPPYMELLHSDGGHLAYDDSGEPITQLFFFEDFEELHYANQNEDGGLDGQYLSRPLVDTTTVIVTTWDEADCAE
jgi:hypothetical protein